MSFFEKMKFKEVITDNVTLYYINNKQVEESTYLSILKDDSLYTLPPLPKMNDSPENNCNNSNNTNNNEDDTEICACEECEEFLQVIHDIREMDDNLALDGLR